MKPLQVFEKHPDADAYKVGIHYSPYCLLATEKRFSDAELAAEWHRSASVEWAAMGAPGDYKPGAQQRAAIERGTIRSFATLPHFDA